MSLKLKQTPQNYFDSGQCMYVISILIIFKTKGVSEYTNSQTISLLECPPAWPHLLNDGSSKPVCLLTTYHGKELNNLPKLPSQISLSFKLKIDQGRKLKHIKAANIYSKKLAHCSQKILPYVSVWCIEQIDELLDGWLTWALYAGFTFPKIDPSLSTFLRFKTIIWAI